MLGMGWLTLRQVRAALQNGRLEEAQQLLSQPSVRGHRKSWELFAGLTRGYVERGEKHLDQDNIAAAWKTWPGPRNWPRRTPEPSNCGKP